MSRALRLADATAALQPLLEENARRAADENTLVAREEQAALDPWLARCAERLRAEGGPGTRVTVAALVARGVADALAAWDQVNPPDAPRDHRWLSLDEIAALEVDHPELHRLTLRLRDAVLAPRVSAALVQAWFGSPAFSAQTFAQDSLPEGGRIDARVNQPGRDRVPPLVARAFDVFARLESRDIASVSLHWGRLEGAGVWAVWAVTDGDDRFLEVLDGQGTTITGARFLGDTVVWDPFPGRSRLVVPVLGVEGYGAEEGLHEPDERAAAGQPPMGWTGAFQVTRGALENLDGELGAVDVGGLTPTPEQRALCVAAFTYLWEVHLRFAAFRSEPVPLGPDQQGVLTVGDFSRCTTGETLLVADWRDIDDGSYVLYFDRTALGLRLRVVQYDN